MNFYKLAIFAVVLNIALCTGSAAEGEKCVKTLEDYLDKVNKKDVETHLSRALSLKKLQEKLIGILGILKQKNFDSNCSKEADFKAYSIKLGNPTGAHKVNFVESLYKKLRAYHVASKTHKSTSS